MRSWYFNLVLDAPLTDGQKDFLDGLDRFAEGGIGLEEGPGYSGFLCVVRAKTLTAAIADTLGRFEDFPGVLVRSVVLDHFDLAANGMATAAVVPTPSPSSAS
ncbi:hypothetical protein GCM10010232_58670 [Streptomyces amakusaensis]|uniref:DUF3303 domain-containing protein n=1 Tax=Streptomyces amakusaensis TaxID=67271 RepID=A0ABW0AP53_9ACTN